MHTGNRYRSPLIFESIFTVLGWIGTYSFLFKIQFVIDERVAAGEQQATAKNE